MLTSPYFTYICSGIESTQVLLVWLLFRHDIIVFIKIIPQRYKNISKRGSF